MENEFNLKNKEGRNNVSLDGGGDMEDDSASALVVSGLILVVSLILIICTFPFSLFFCVRMLQVDT